jgi:hypothetical protein
MERAKNILLQNGLAKNLWLEAINTTNYVVNRSTSRANQRKMLGELFLGAKTEFTTFKDFWGCCAHFHLEFL